ncbi:1,3-beta-glucanosyltransferase [Haplosporangium sp. Z 11]|nr:1,3-beta-glucanosyltransferase [Haplosporangium sp. Z 11]
MEQVQAFRVPLSRMNASMEAKGDDLPAEWAFTLRKYVLTERSDGQQSMPLTFPNFLLWMCAWTDRIGSPAQTVRMQFDTGSSRFVIATSECRKCAGYSHFDRSKSTTFGAGTRQPWQIRYRRATSYALGVMGQDRVTLGDITVMGQDLSLVEDESDTFERSVDGVLGLSLGAISGVDTVFQNMMSQGVVARGMFSIYLGKQSLGGGGEVVFGGLDMARVAPGHDITYSPVISRTRWMVRFRDILVNGVALSRSTPSTTFPAVLDTGTTLLTLPSEVADWINQQIPGAKYVNRRWAIPCSSKSRLQFEIEGKRFSVPSEDLVRGRSCAAGQGMCHSTVQTSSARYMILGDVFIKNNYVVFDQNNRRIGIAPLNL